jgi:Leucine-rich repeat (LRR) protein
MPTGSSSQVVRELALVLLPPEILQKICAPPLPLASQKMVWLSHSAFQATHLGAKKLAGAKMAKYPDPNFDTSFCLESLCTTLESALRNCELQVLSLDLTEGVSEASHVMEEILSRIGIVPPCNVVDLTLSNSTLNSQQLDRFLVKFPNLTVLNLSECNELITLPESISNLGSLQTLNLNECSSIKYLPNTLGNLKSLQTLKLALCENLTSLPDSLSELHTLETLSLSQCNGLEALPDMSKLDKLKAVDVSACQNLAILCQIIEEVNWLQNLELRFCQDLENLPDISAFKNLQNLDVSGCSNLEALPDYMRELINLKILNITDCNILTNFPARLAQLQRELPNLEILY